MSYQIHWFKKNLRFQDNEILLKIDNSSSILIYIIEPELWLQRDMSQRQWEFIWESVKSSKKAKDTIYGIRKMINHKTLAKSVFLKHGSRNSH